MPGKRRKKPAEYRGEQNKETRGIPRGTEQRKAAEYRGKLNKEKPASDAGEKKKGNIMEIILSTQCESLTGSLGKGYGYYIRRAPRKDGSVRFYSQRSKWYVPRDGHMRFIFTCAELAQMSLHIADIRVKKEELYDALTEANHWIAARSLRLPLYNARDIINLKITFSL